MCAISRVFWINSSSVSNKLKLKDIINPTNENSPSCRSKPVRLTFSCGKKMFWKMKKCFCAYNESQWIPLTFIRMDKNSKNILPDNLRLVLFGWTLLLNLKSHHSECHLCIPAELRGWSASDENHHVGSAGNSWEQTVWQDHIGL